jgi:hypothetical protein
MIPAVQGAPGYDLISDQVITCHKDLVTGQVPRLGSGRQEVVIVSRVESIQSSILSLSPAEYAQLNAWCEICEITSPPSP